MAGSGVDAALEDQCVGFPDQQHGCRHQYELEELADSRRPASWVRDSGSLGGANQDGSLSQEGEEEGSLSRGGEQDGSLSPQGEQEHPFLSGQGEQKCLV